MCAHPGRSHLCVADSPPQKSSRHPSGGLDIADGGRYLQRGPGVIEEKLQVRQLSAAEIQKITGGPGNGFRKRSEHCETILLLLWGSLCFGPSAAGNQENPRGPGNGFRERSEHCEIADFAAFVGFPSFPQLSAAENPENPRGPGTGFWKSSEHCEKDDFAAFVVFPSFRQLSAAGNPENLRGLGNGFRKRSEHWEGRFCCFCGVPLISAAFGALEMASGKGAKIAKWTILLLLWGSPHFGSYRAQEIQKTHGALEMASGKGANIAKWTILLFISAASRKSKRHCEKDDFAAFVGFPSFRQLSATGNPENLRGPGNGFRKRSENRPSRASSIFWISGRRKLQK